MVILIYLEQNLRFVTLFSLKNRYISRFFFLFPELINYSEVFTEVC